MALDGWSRAGHGWRNRCIALYSSIALKKPYSSRWLLFRSACCFFVRDSFFGRFALPLEQWSLRREEITILVKL